MSSFNSIHGNMSTFPDNWPQVNSLEVEDIFLQVNSAQGNLPPVKFLDNFLPVSSPQDHWPPINPLDDNILTVNATWSTLETGGTSLNWSLGGVEDRDQLPLINHIDRWTSGGVQRLVTLSLLMIVTLVGNVLIISVLTCKTKYRTVNRRVNIFIVNLAVGDLTVCAFTMTSEVLFVVFENGWVLGDAACRVIVYVQIVTLASTTFILTAMSIDRYLIVSRPLSFSPARGSRAAAMILVSWLMALIFAVPQIFIFKAVAVGVYAADGVIKYECASRGYTAWWQRKTYFTLMAMYILVIPTGIITFCYFKVVRAVWAQGRPQNPPPRGEELPQPGSMGVGSVSSQHPLPVGGALTSRVQTKQRYWSAPRNRLGHHPGARWYRGDQEVVEMVDRRVITRSPLLGVSSRSSVASSSKSVIRAKVQTIKMTFSIICSFIACWTPYFVVHLVRIWSEYEHQIPASVLAFADTIALLNSALNPILYACFTVKLKRRLGKAFCCCRCRAGVRSLSTRSSASRVREHRPINGVVIGECRRGEAGERGLARGRNDDVGVGVGAGGVGCPPPREGHEVVGWKRMWGRGVGEEPGVGGRVGGGGLTGPGTRSGSCVTRYTAGSRNAAVQGRGGLNGPRSHFRERGKLLNFRKK